MGGRGKTLTTMSGRTTGSIHDTSDDLALA
jgi:hypothetical protein